MKGSITVGINHNYAGLVIYRAGREIMLQQEEIRAFCAWAKPRIAQAIGADVALVYCWGTGREMWLVEKLGESASIRNVDAVELADGQIAICFTAKLFVGDVPSSGIMVVTRVNDGIVRHQFDVRTWAQEQRPELLRGHAVQETA
ncbi:hypothetical protein HY631_00195 [Candidatus Uhrbacteria bacterium]|nr:hypothetical protein [Candidatus Uhrbacteria bacterium]